MIYNYAYNTGASATIGSIVGDFVGNYVSSTSNYINGGMIYNYAGSNGTVTIDSITGDFVGNYVSSGNYIQGGMIYNYASGSGLTAEIGSITGDFVGNYVYSGSYTQGGMVYNSGEMVIENSSFYNNIVKSDSGTIKGSVIYTSSDMSVVAKDGYTSTISGNYAQVGSGDKKYDAIYVDDGAVLRLKTQTGGKFEITDNIVGRGIVKFDSANAKDINVSGDIREARVQFENNGYTMAQLNIDNATFDIFDAGINTITLDNLTLKNNDSKLMFDVDLAGLNTDRIVTTTITSNNKKISLDTIAIISDGAGTNTSVRLTDNSALMPVYILNDNYTQYNQGNYSYLVTYDNTTGYLNFVRDQELADLSQTTLTRLHNLTPSESPKESGYTLSKGLAGDNVIYKYQLDDNDKVVGTGYELTLAKTSFGTSDSSKVYKVNAPNSPVDITVLGTSESRIDNTISSDITGVFHGRNAAADTRGGAIYNTNADKSGYTIEADFIGNYSPYRGGAIGNYATGSSGVAKLGDITGYFVGNYAAVASAIYNQAIGASSEANIKSITGYFVGNYSMNNNGWGAIFNQAITGTGARAIIGDITADFIGNYVTATGGQQHGGAISNRSQVANSQVNTGDVKGDFIGNYISITSGYTFGGAIGNVSNASGSTVTMDDIVGDFVGNKIVLTAVSATSIQGGGAIGNYSHGANSVITLGDITGSFHGNYIQGNYGYGGAIGNYTANATASVSMGEINSDFYKNYVSGEYQAYGGAIGNYAYTGNSTIENVSGNFRGNYVVSTSGGAHGGAIYNSGTGAAITISDSVFINNYASTGTSTATNAQGGAIWNSGTVNLVAKTKDVTFSGNYTEVGGLKSYNDIYNQGTVNIKAKRGKAITFGGRITDASTPAGTLNIGNGVSESGYSGTVNFNNTVTQNAVNLNSGTLHLGIANALANVGTFTNNGCTLDTVTNAAEAQTLNNLTLNSDLNLVFDVIFNSSTITADTFGGTVANANGYHLVINSLNFVGTPTVGTVTVFDSNLKGLVQYNISKAWVRSSSLLASEYSTSTGVISFVAHPFGDTTLDNIHNESSAYLGGSHATYTLSTSQGNRTNSIYINGTKYWYTPNESASGTYSAAQMNAMLVNLANTGSAALVEGTSSNYVFYDGTKYWTYSINRELELFCG